MIQIGVKIPVAAMPVVEILRRDVKKPRALPRSGIQQMMQIVACLRWESGKCPMGLHSLSNSRCPFAAWEFAGGACHNDAVHAFAEWWDLVPGDQANAAVDAIWGVS